MAKSYFAILEITSNATADEVHSAYRRLAKRFHPDYYQGGSERFQQIQKAYTVLSDPVRRSAHEKTLSNVPVRKAPEIRPNAQPEPLIPRNDPVDMGAISPLRPIETLFPSFDQIKKDRTVVIPLERFGIGNLYLTLQFRPWDGE